MKRVTIPYLCMSSEQLEADQGLLKQVLLANAASARNTLVARNIVASKTTTDDLLVAAAELSYLGQRMQDQVLCLEAREAIRMVKAKDSSMPDAVIDLFDNDAIMPEEEDTMPDTQEGNDSSVDKSKSDLDQTWSTIKTYVAKIKDAIRKLNERINKQIHENLRTYMKTGKINASSGMPITKVGKGPFHVATWGKTEFFLYDSRNGPAPRTYKDDNVISKPSFDDKSKAVEVAKKLNALPENAWETEESGPRPSDTYTYISEGYESKYKAILTAADMPKVRKRVQKKTKVKAMPKQESKINASGRGKLNPDLYYLVYKDSMGKGAPKDLYDYTGYETEYEAERKAIKFQREMEEENDDDNSYEMLPVKGSRLIELSPRQFTASSKSELPRVAVRKKKAMKKIATPENGSKVTAVKKRNG